MAALLEDQRSRGGSAHKRWFTSSSSRAPLPSSSPRSIATDAPTVLSSSRMSTPSFDGPIIEPTAHEPAVRITDAELLLRARAAKTQSQQQRSAHVPAFAIESRSTRYRWRRRKHLRNGFALFSRESSERLDADGSAVACHQVLAVGDVRCSVRELAHILRTSTAAEHNAVMRGLYDDDFIVGSVVHVAAPATVASVAPKRASRGPRELLTQQQLAVKTNVFARPNFLTRNEQWCVLELLELDAAADAFTLTLTSLADGDVSTGKLQRAGEQRVVQLHGIIALLTVEPVLDTASARVVFHSSFCDAPRSHLKRSSAASTRASKVRLLALAAGLSRLPELVQRRRFGVQTPVDLALVVATNTRCPCCTRTLHVLSKKTQCFLCGYAVCDSDWAIHDMDTGRGCITPVRVCARCLEAVERCDYAHVTPESLGGAAVQPDAHDVFGASASSVRSTSGETLATLLTDALHTSSAQRKLSVMAVIKHLVASTAPGPSASAPADTIALTDRSDDAAYVSALNAYARVAEPLPLQECVLASSSTRGRTYPLDPVRDHATLAREFPVPANEAERLTVIATHRLMDADDSSRRSSADDSGSSVTEQLNVICALAARELDCSLSAVTIIGRTTQRIVASNVEMFRMVTMPRSEGFCQHTVMAPAPLLVPHPEADVRFAHLQGLQSHAFRFYCGFPLTSPSRAVVGTICCLDTKSHALTQSQYATMTRLAETASRILELRGSDDRVD